MTAVDPNHPAYRGQPVNAVDPYGQVAHRPRKQMSKSRKAGWWSFGLFMGSIPGFFLGILPGVLLFVLSLVFGFISIVSYATDHGRH